MASTPNSRTNDGLREYAYPSYPEVQLCTATPKLRLLPVQERMKRKTTITPEHKNEK